MRLGVVLSEPWAADAARAQELGFELGLIDERHTPAPLVLAAFLAPATDALRIVATVTAGAHPLTIAEEAAVADLALGGRLVLGVRSGDEALLAETLDVLNHAFAARPFRHEGQRWRVPANLPEHEHAETLVRVTPAPAQLELPIWVSGSAAPAVARSHGVSLVVDAGGAAPGPAAARLRRPALRTVDASADHFDPAALVEDLRRDQLAWGLDVAILELPTTLTPERRAAILLTIATDVRPALQLASLPDGLTRYWADSASAPDIG